MSHIFELFSSLLTDQDLWQAKKEAIKFLEEKTLLEPGATPEKHAFTADMLLERNMMVHSGNGKMKFDQ